MTKRWLSLVLVLTLLSTLFAGTAFAVGEVPLTFDAAQTPFALIANTKYENYSLGTVKANGSAVTNLAASPATTVSDGNSGADFTVTSVAVDATGTLKATFTTKGVEKTVAQTASVSREVETDEYEALTGAFTYTIAPKPLIFTPAAITLRKDAPQLTNVVLGTFADITNLEVADVELNSTLPAGVITGALSIDPITKELKTATLQGATAGSGNITVQLTSAGTNKKFTMTAATVPVTTTGAAELFPVTFTVDDATNPPNGTKRVTLVKPAPVGTGNTVKVFYNVGTGTVAEPTSSSTLYTAPINLTTAGDYTVKAVAYEYTPAGVYVADSKSTVASKAVAVNTAVDSVTINQQGVVIVGNGSQVYTATVVPASSKETVAWSIVGDPITGLTGAPQADGSYKVTSNGFVGTYTVKATVGGKETTSAGLVKAQNVTDFDLPASITVAKGETVQVTGSSKPSNVTIQEIQAAVATSPANIAEIVRVGAVGDIDPKTGVNTWKVTGTNVGTTTVTFTARNHGSAGAVNGISRNVTINVVAPTKTPPTPIFSKPDGTVFTVQHSDTIGAQVTVDSGVAAGSASAVVTKVSTDYGATWTTLSSPIDININKTKTVWAKNVKGTGTTYEGESAIAKATFKSEVAVTGVTLWDTFTASTGAYTDARTAAVTINGSGTKDVYAKVAPYSTSLNPNKSLAKDPSVTFTSSNPAVAKVEYKKYDTSKQAATVTGVSAGTATITAKSADGKQSAKFDVTVAPVTPTQIVVKQGTIEVSTSPAATVTAGQYTKLTAKVLGTDGTKLAFNQNVTWAVVNGTDKITVTDGKVVGLNEGTAQIRVTSQELPTLDKVVNVTVSPASGTVAPIALTATKADSSDVVFAIAADGTSTGSDTNIAAEVTVELATATEGATIYYTLDGTDPLVSSTRIAYAEGGFKLSGPKSVKIRAIAMKSDLPNSTALTQAFTFAIPVTAITMDATATVAKGSTLQLQATIAPANATDKTITWSLANAEGTTAGDVLATIDTATGLLTAKKAGVVKVTATPADTAGGATAVSCVVTITGDPIATLTIIPSEVTLNVAGVQQLQYRATRVSKSTEGGTWKSSDDKIATVNTTGKVTAVKEGEATITLTLDGQTATAKVTVTADPLNIPAEPANAAKPTYTATKKEFSGMGKSSLSAVVGKLTPAAGTTLEQVFYYYNLSVEVDDTSVAAALKNEFNFVVDKNGEVTVHIANLPNNSFFFNYKLKLEQKGSRGTNTLELADATAKVVTVTGNVVTITAVPTAINATTPEIADQELPQSGTVAMGTVGNFADFQATGVALTATPNVTPVPKATKDGFSAAIDANGQIILTVAGAQAGTYTVTVTVSAPGCADVTTKAVKVTVKADPIPAEKKISVDTKTPKFDAKPYKKKSVWVLNLTDGTATFSVPGYTATGWKSSKTKLMSIDANGVATLKKAGSTRITVSAKVDGKTVTQLVVIRKMAEQVKLQYKQGKKWIDFDGNPLTVKIGKKSKVLTRVVVVTPAKATILGGSWKIEDPTIATRGTKGYIVGLKEGKTSVTFTAHNGISVSCEFTVANQIKGAEEIEEIIPETEVTEPVEETEEVVEVVEEAPVEEAPVEEIPAA
ncbi:Ig domain-containing protein [Bacillota bacterium Meth-B3]